MPGFHRRPAKHQKGVGEEFFISTGGLSEQPGSGARGRASSPSPPKRGDLPGHLERLPDDCPQGHYHTVLSLLGGQGLGTILRIPGTGRCLAQGTTALKKPGQAGGLEQGRFSHFRAGCSSSSHLESLGHRTVARFSRVTQPDLPAISNLRNKLWAHSCPNWQVNVTVSILTPSFMEQG